MVNVITSRNVDSCDQVKDRGTKLLLLPIGMSKRSANTSHIDPKSKCIQWRINLAFVMNNEFTMNDICSFDSFVPSPSNLSICQSRLMDHSLNLDGPRIDYQAFSLQSSLVGVCLNNINENMTLQSVIDHVLDNLQVFSYSCRRFEMPQKLCMLLVVDFLRVDLF
jgi:hypothetical protein